MRSHVDRVASSVLGCLDNRLIGLFVLKMHQVAGHARRRRNILRYVQIFARESRHVFLVLLKRVRDHARGAREDMERRRYRYGGDSGTKSLRQCHTFIKGHLR